MIHLADIADADPSWLKEMMIFLFAATTVVMSILAAKRKMPQPFQVSRQKDCIDRSEHDALKTTVDHMTGELHAMERRLHQAGEDRIVKVHDRIEPLSRVIHELSGEVKQLAMHVHNLNTSVQRSVRK